jgi:hypothetical protein
MARNRLASVAIVGGMIIAIAAQRGAPIAGPPLYDGVVVVAPYVWLSPPPGLHGGAKSDRETFPVSSGGFGVQTQEQPPQAQASLDFDSLLMPAGTKSVIVTIRPVPPPAVAPSDGIVAGNVYSIEATNQVGEAVQVQPGSQIAIILRGPTSLLAGYIELFAGGAWTSEDTDPVGVPDMYTTLVGSFGEFALVSPDVTWVPDGETGPPPTAAATASPAASSTYGSSSLQTAASTTDLGRAPAAGSTSSSPAVRSGSTAGSSGQGSPLPLPQIGAVAIGLLVILAAGFIMTRPVRPPGS